MYLRQGYLSKLVDQEARLQLARLQLALDESTLGAREFAIVSIRIGRHGLGLDGARDLAGSLIAANGAIRRAQGESEAGLRPDLVGMWRRDHRRRRKWPPPPKRPGRSPARRTRTTT